MTSFTKKFIWIVVAITIYVVAIAYQSFHTIIIEGDLYREKVSKLKVDSISIDPMRGFIFGDNDEMLAGSLPEYDVCLDFKTTTRIDPGIKEQNIPQDTINKYFAPNGPGSRALEEISQHRKSATEFGKEVREAYRQKKNSYPILQSVPYLDYKRLRTMPYFSKSNYRCGVIKVERAHRYRPYGDSRMASCTIGDVYPLKKEIRVVDGDSILYTGLGRSGLELAFDSLLRGKPGWGYRKKIRGRMLEVTQRQPVHGANVHTTINVEMQDILDRALCKRILDLQASGGWAAVMEVKTGKIKAISNLRRDSENQCTEDHNHLFEDLVDPGSTFKTVSYMVLLDEGKITPETKVNTRNTTASPSTFNYHGKQVRDDHPVGEVTADEAICQSSNIAVAMLTTQAYEKNPKDYLAAIDKMKIFDNLQLNTEFPKAQYARKRKVNDKTWSKVSLGQICYGYETQIPGIYMLNFYNAIANDGRLMQPYIVDYIEKDGNVIFRQEPRTLNKKICKPETLKAVRHALEGVVEHGTAAGNQWLPGAKSDKIRIAGKTGTAQRYANGNFSYANGHNVSFVGYFPADNPLYSCIVVISTRPGGTHGRPGGGYMAGPVFKTLAEEVYALHFPHKLKDMAQDTRHHFYPSVKGGFADDIDYTLDEMNFKVDRIASRKEIAKATPIVTDSMEHKMRFEIQKNTTNGQTVPNVIGMGASDALFILENHGLNVAISGKGKVVKQSLSPGSSYRKNQHINLVLK